MRVVFFNLILPGCRPLPYSIANGFLIVHMQSVLNLSPLFENARPSINYHMIENGEGCGGGEGFLC